MKKYTKSDLEKAFTDGRLYETNELILDGYKKDETTFNMWFRLTISKPKPKAKTPKDIFDRIYEKSKKDLSDFRFSYEDNRNIVYIVFTLDGENLTCGVPYYSHETLKEFETKVHTQIKELMKLMKKYG